MKYFYSHIIEIDTLLSDLSELDITSEEKEKLENLIHSSAHHAVVDSLLSSLPIEAKKEFVTHLNTSSHENIFDFLKKNVENVEDIIKNAAHTIRDEFHADVKALKEKK